MQIYQTLPNLDIHFDITRQTTKQISQRLKMILRHKAQISAPRLVTEYPVDPNRTKHSTSGPRPKSQTSLISLGEHQPARPAIQDLDICQSLGSINKSRDLQKKQIHSGVNKKKQQAYLVMASSTETNTSNESIVCGKLQ